MTRTYIVDGITCSGCVATVKSRLTSNPDITAADVVLEDRKATLSMRRELSLDELQTSIGVSSKYKIRANEPDTVLKTEKKDEEKTWLATYKPLLIITAFIAGVSVLTAKGELMTGMNHFMSGFFLVFSFFKLLDLKGFASSYAMYDVLASRIKAWGFIYPFVELGLGIAFLTGFYPDTTLWITIVIMSVSSIGVIKSVANKQKIKCACLGAVFNLPMSTVTIIEDLLMVAMSASMLVYAHR